MLSYITSNQSSQSVMMVDGQYSSVSYCMSMSVSKLEHYVLKEANNIWAYFTLDEFFIE